MSKTQIDPNAVGPVFEALEQRVLLSGSVIHLTPSDNWYNVLNGGGLSPGDEVILHEGVYSTSPALTMQHVGTAVDPIIIRAADGESVTITRPDAGQNVINMHGTQYVTLRGLEVTGGSAAIRIGNGGTGRMAEYVTIEYCWIHDTGANAITANYVGDVNTGHIFRYNEISNTAAEGEGFYLGSNNDAEGQTTGVFRDGLIEGNYIHHLNGPAVTQGDGIEIKDGSYNNTIRDNVIHDTGYPGILVYGTDGNGDNIIEGNVIWNAGDHAIQAAADAVIRNNIILSENVYGIASQNHQSAIPGNLTIIHNTIFSQGTRNAINVSWPSGDQLSGPIVIANNALYPQGTGRPMNLANLPGYTIAGNVGTGTPYPSQPVSAFDPSGNILTDFGDVANKDVFPIPGSALIAAGNAGYVLDTDFNGVDRDGVADVGAYAYDAGGNPGWAIAPEFKDVSVTGPLVRISAPDDVATEAGQTTATFTVSRGSLTAGNLTVYYTVGGTASAGDYVETLSGQVTIPDGQSSVDITITPVDDVEPEGDETVAILLSTDPAYRIAGPSQDAVTIVDDDIPTVTIAATDANAAEEGQDPGTFTVTRDKTAGDLVVNYAVSGSASGADYAETLSGQVTIPDGQPTADITITPVDDMFFEGDETVTLTLAAGTLYNVGAPDSDTVTIADNEDIGTGVLVDFETPGDEADFVNLYNNPGVSRVAGNGGFVLDLNKNNAVGSVKYSPSGDYTLDAGTVAADVHMRYYWDTTWGDAGPSHALILKEWTDSQAQHGGYVVVLKPGSGKVGLFVGASNIPGAGTESWEFYGSGAGHTDRLAVPAMATYTPIQVPGTHDLDWWYLSASMSIVNGTDVQIDVTVVEADLTEHHHTWTDAGAAAVTGAGPVGLSVRGVWSLTAQFDNFTVVPEGAQVPTVTLSATDAAAAEQGQDTGTFTVSRGAETSGDLTVYYTVGGSASAGDYVEALSGQVTIPDGLSSADITITPVDDSEVEGDETVTLTLSADAAYTIGSPASDTVTIADNDVPTVTLSATDASAAEQGQDPGTFTVSRGAETSGDLTVYYTVGGSASSGDYVESLSGQVTIPDGQSYADIPITPVDDGEIENDETVILTLSADPAYTIGSPASDTVTIADDDVPEVTIAATDAAAAEEQQDPGEFTVTRNGTGLLTQGDLVVHYTVGGSASAGDYVETLSGQVTIPDGQASATIAITPVDDGDVEGDETVTLTLSADAAYTIGSPASDTVTIADNDAVATDDEAVGETPVAGTVWGTYVDTHAGDDVYESITEVLSGTNPPSKRYSYLEHRWTFQVTGGDTVTFHLQAHHTPSSDGDDFLFQYSTNGTDWTDMVTVTKTADDDTYQTCALPDSLSGTVYVRVIDTDHTKRNQDLDTVFIDDMFIRSA